MSTDEGLYASKEELEMAAMKERSKVPEGLPWREGDRQREIQRGFLTKDEPAFVGSIGNDGDVAMSVYYVPEGETEVVGDILFRLGGLQQLEELSAYLQVAIPILRKVWEDKK